jgi:hypothetical protein
MGVTSPAIPKYEISRLKIPPNVSNSERNHPTATSGIVDIYLLAPPSSPAAPSYPALPSGSLGISSILPAHPKNVLVIQMSPGTHGSMVVFAFFWVVGFVPYAFMK